MTARVSELSDPGLLAIPRRRHIGQTREDLLAHLMNHVDDDGGIHEKCGSRVLESALMLTLLHRENLFPDVRRGLAGYLRRASLIRDAAPFDRMLAPAALGRPTVLPFNEALAWLDEYDHFTAVRKRRVFGSVLGLLGVVAPEDIPDLSAVRYRGMAPWVELCLCALKVINAYGRGTPHQVSDEDRVFLFDRLADNLAAGCHFTSYLLALYACGLLRSGSSVVRDGAAQLVQLRSADGGMPFVPEMEIFCTATAGLALVRAGAPRALMTRMADFLVALQSADGGWAFTATSRQSDVDDTAYCVEFLREFEPVRYAVSIRAAQDFLVSLVNADGGFPTFQRGHQSEVTMTAGAVIALAPRWDRYGAVIGPALDYLLDAQREDGAFERSWSLSEADAMFRAAHAAQAIPPGRLDQRLQDRISLAATRSVGYLERTHNSDGGWGQRAGDASDVLSTSYSVLTAACWGRHQLGAKGLQYLMDVQEPGGGFTSIPDQCAPRPLPYDFPVLADVYALMALGVTGGA